MNSWPAWFRPSLSLSTHLFCSALLARKEDTTAVAAAGESARCGGGRGWEEAVADGCCCGVGGGEICWPSCCGCGCFALLPVPKPFGLPSPADADETTVTRAGVVARFERPAGGARRCLIGIRKRSCADARKRANSHQEKKSEVDVPLLVEIFISTSRPFLVPSPQCPRN